MMSTIVVSVYRDVPSLRTILYSLNQQTTNNFEVIVSEDGESSEVRDFLETQSVFPSSRLRHITQPDVGFRKNKALNRAIKASKTEHLIFIDGDCVPATNFILAHQSQGKGLITAGRRLELGRRMSERFLKRPSLVRPLSSFWGYFVSAPFIVIDGGKNIESGFHCQFLDHLRANRAIELVGCNFSAPKRFLEEVNGFNEEYESPGIGEDSDIHWRMAALGFRTVSVKFQAILFHLSHPRNYIVSETNFKIFNRCKDKNEVVARLGLRQ